LLLSVLESLLIGSFLLSNSVPSVEILHLRASCEERLENLLFAGFRRGTAVYAK